MEKAPTYIYWTTAFWLKGMVLESCPQKFILGAVQVAGVSLKLIALLLLSTISSQHILRELFYNLSDFSNTLFGWLVIFAKNTKQICGNS
jgi:hypothetical protein